MYSLRKNLILEAHQSGSNILIILIKIIGYVFFKLIGPKLFSMELTILEFLLHLIETISILFFSGVTKLSKTMPAMSLWSRWLHKWSLCQGWEIRPTRWGTVEDCCSDEKMRGRQTSFFPENFAVIPFPSSEFWHLTVCLLGSYLYSP